jgi:hypothetical protein
MKLLIRFIRLILVLVLVSATFASSPGPLVAANFVATNAYLAANSTLGRTLAGGQANMTIDVVEPGALYVGG